MGRLRIKKKEAVIAFRDTLAYRMILVSGSILLFIIALAVMIGARANINASFIAAAVIVLAAAFATYYNLDQLRHAKIPQQTLKRMKRR